MYDASGPLGSQCKHLSSQKCRHFVLTMSQNLGATVNTLHHSSSGGAAWVPSWVRDTAHPRSLKRVLFTGQAKPD